VAIFTFGIKEAWIVDVEELKWIGESDEVASCAQRLKELIGDEGGGAVGGKGFLSDNIGVKGEEKKKQE